MLAFMTFTMRVVYENHIRIAGRLVEVVQHHHNRSAVRVEVVQQVQHVDLMRHIKVSGRLTQQQYVGFLGGDLGRKYPLSLNVEDGVLLSSPELERLEAMGASTDPDQVMLDDVNEYRAAVRALAMAGDDKLLRSAYFIPASQLYFMGDGPMSLLDLENPTDALEMPTAEPGASLPPYSLAVIADMATPAQQTVIVGLVYTTEESAQAAAGLLPDQLASTTAITAGISWSEFLEEREIALADVQIINTDDRYVVVLPFVYAPPVDDSEIFLRPQASGLGYLVFIQALFNRDLAWLMSGA